MERASDAVGTDREDGIGGCGMYRVGDRVKTWWQGRMETGVVIEVVHGHCYRVRLSTAEICYRLESDLVTA